MKVRIFVTLNELIAFLMRCSYAEFVEARDLGIFMLDCDRHTFEIETNPGPSQPDKTNLVLNMVRSLYASLKDNKYRLLFTDDAERDYQTLALLLRDQSLYQAAKLIEEHKPPINSRKVREALGTVADIITIEPASR